MLEDPVALDRRVMRAATSLRQFRRALKHAPAAEHQFSGLGGRDAELELRELLSRAPSDPITHLTARWAFRLYDEELHAPWVVAVERAFRAKTFPIDRPTRGEFSALGLLLRALREPERRTEWITSLLEHGVALRDARRRLWDKRGELRERLGVEQVERLVWPNPEIVTSAERWLALTAGAFAELGVRDLAALLEISLGKADGADFPARLSPRALVELLDARGWFEKHRLHLDDVPEPIAPASFARALGSVGFEFRTALGRTSFPFVAAEDPFGQEAWTFSYLFAGLLTDPDFMRRKLAVSRANSTTYARSLHGAWLAHSRMEALRVLSLNAALFGGASFETTFQERSHQALGFELDPGFGGLLFMPRSDSLQRFAALFGAARKNQDFTERHDEDWYRNPRAREELTEEARLPPQIEVTAAEVEKGQALLRRTLTQYF